MCTAEMSFKILSTSKSWKENPSLGNPNLSLSGQWIKIMMCHLDSFVDSLGKPTIVKANALLEL